MAKMIFPKMEKTIPKTASKPRKNKESKPQDKYHSAFPLSFVFSVELELKDLILVSFIIKKWILKYQ